MSDDEKMTSTRKLIQEKFGFTSNLPNHNNRMHDDVTVRNGKGSANPAYLPVEEFRKNIKLLMGATTTEEDENLKKALDFRMLRRLAKKYDVGIEEDIDLLEKAFEKHDRNLISREWERIKDKMPFWFVGMLSANIRAGQQVNAGKENEELPENDKAALVNLWDAMEAINDESDKHGKEWAKNTPRADRDTQAAKNLQKAKKDAGIPDKAPHDLDKKPENEIGVEDED